MRKLAWTAVRHGGVPVTLAVVLAIGAHTAEAAQLCVNMGNSDGQVAGMQVDVVWDSACMTATPGRGTSAGCTANPATGKTVSSRLISPGSMRLLLFATDNVDPIPDGQLLCCAFQEPKNPCCSLQMGKLIASSPSGVRLNGIQFEAALNGVPCAALASGAEGSSRPQAARGPLQAQPQGPVAAEGGATGGETGAPSQQGGQAQPPAQQAAQAQPKAGAPGAGGPIGVPPPTSPLQQAQAEREAGTAEQPPSAPAAAPAGGGGEPARVGQAGQALAPATPPETAGPMATAGAPTPEAAAPPTNTKPLPTKTPTQPAPTVTPTKGGGFFSGCQMQR